jgi:Ca2+-binding RTX toxin-like protein
MVSDFFRENSPYNPWNPLQGLRFDGAISWSINAILAHVPGVILGGAAADLLLGTAVDDLMLGQAGNDTFVAGGGNDLLDGEAGLDLVSYAGWSFPLHLNLSLQVPQDTLSAGRVTIRAVENLLAGSGADLLIGDLANNRLDGAAGDDTLDGGAGSDTLIGGANGPFGDTVTYAATAAAVTVNLATTVSQRTGGSGNDLLIGLEHLVGSSFNDTLTGDGQSNRIAGGAGNDVIRGGLGSDTLSGGAGNDRFVYGTPAEAGLGLPEIGSVGRDRIIDFQLGDRIDLALIDANPTLTGNQAFSFIGLAPFSALGQVRFLLSSHGSVVLEGNCLATLDPDFQLEIAGLTGLPATALIL